MKTAVIESDIPTLVEETYDEAFECAKFQRRTLDLDLSIGATLAQARIESGRTRQFFARKLNIPERYLRAIEDEDFTALPGLVYEKHFVHRYATAVRLDADPLVARWVTLREGAAKPVTKFVPRVRRRDLWMSPIALRRGAVALLFLVMATYVGGRLFTMVQPPSLVVNEPADSQVLHEADLVVAGTVPVDTRVEINGQTVSIDPQGQFSLPVTLEEGGNTIRVVAERRYGRAAVVERRVFLAPADHLSASSPNTP